MQASSQKADLACAMDHTVNYDGTVRYYDYWVGHTISGNQMRVRWDAKREAGRDPYTKARLELGLPFQVPSPRFFFFFFFTA
jgi:hypothetical protein